MQSYLESSDATEGIFVHSAAREIALWHEIERNTQRMTWARVSPAALGEKDEESDISVQRIIERVTRVA